MKRMILIGARGGLGDLTLFSSVLKSFREDLYPNHHIICGTSRSCSELALSIPYFDEFIIDYRPRYVRNHRGRIFYRDKRNGTRIDNIECYFDLNHPYKHVDESTAAQVHIIDLAASILGVRSFERKGLVFLRPENSQTATEKLARYSDSPKIFIAPFCSQKTKEPPFKMMIQMANRINLRTGMAPIFLVPPDFENDQLKWPSISDSSILNVSAMINQADYFIGLDSGLSHIAAALSIPMSTIHIGYTVERSGVLNNRAKIFWFNDRKALLEGKWTSVVDDLIDHMIGNMKRNYSELDSINKDLNKSAI